MYNNIIMYRSLHVDLTSQLEEFRQHLEHNAREIPELKAWQLQGILFSPVYYYNNIGM